MNTRCQVFTPKDYVAELLDIAGYNENLYGRKLLENSCGDGNILVAVVERYIDYCLRQNFSAEKIREGLESDIVGVEVDFEQYKKCIANLDAILAKKQVPKVQWNILNADYLKLHLEDKFDFVIGNPPYVTYVDLEKNDRKFLRENFASCKRGKCDYCYAFIEKSLRALKPDGRMSYLIPSSIFKTVFGDELRNMIKPYLVKIKDYSLQKVFDSVLVKSSIILLDKGQECCEFHYINVESGLERNISKTSLGSKWCFSDADVALTENRRFGDYFRVSHSVATLRNKIYVLSDDDYDDSSDDTLASYKGYHLEKSIVKQAASPRGRLYNKCERIIFPYYYQNGTLKKYTEDKFKETYPMAYEYLSANKSELLKREKDDSAKWFEYGRSQALSNLLQSKLLMSTVVTDGLTVYELPEYCVPYAGVYIIKKDKDSPYDLRTAKRVLESDDFLQYVLRVGVPMNGKSFRITSKDIENYMFSL